MRLQPAVHAAALVSFLGLLATWRLWQGAPEFPAALLSSEYGAYDAEQTPKKIYQGIPKEADQLHPNRIDDYDCFFNGCADENGDSLIGTGAFELFFSQ